MSFQSGGGYRSPQMVQAERELDGRIDFAFGKARTLRAKVEEVEQKLAEDAQPPTNAEVERFKAYVLGHGRTAEWQVVLERIGRGELTWRQIVEGVADGRFDRDVSAAMASLSRVPPASMESLVEIGVLPDLEKAGQAEEQDAEQPAGDDGETPGEGASSARDDNDDDEWFEAQSVLR